MGQGKTMETRSQIFSFYRSNLWNPPPIPMATNIWTKRKKQEDNNKSTRSAGGDDKRARLATERTLIYAFSDSVSRYMEGSILEDSRHGTAINYRPLKWTMMTMVERSGCTLNWVFITGTQVIIYFLPLYQHPLAPSTLLPPLSSSPFIDEQRPSSVIFNRRLLSSQ